MKIFIVMRNADFTEGRGPMLFDSAFLHGEHAVRYVSARPGIYGSKQSVQMNKYGLYASANGYDIREVEVYEDDIERIEEMEEAERASALRKLSKREKDLLGL